MDDCKEPGCAIQMDHAHDVIVLDGLTETQLRTELARYVTALRDLYALHDQDTYINATRTRPTAQEWRMAWQRAGEALGQIGQASQVG